MTILLSRRLHLFAAAAKELHFTRAAAQIPVTQAAVSSAVCLLEKSLDKPLFGRTKRGYSSALTITPYGELVACYAQQVAVLEQAMLDDLQNLTPAQALQKANEMKKGEGHD